MALTDGQEALSMEQIADAINRQKLGNQKNKNRLINWGMENQDAFRQKYGSSIVRPVDKQSVTNNIPNIAPQIPEISSPVYDNIPISNSINSQQALSQPDIESILSSKGYKRAQSAIDPKLASILGFNDIGTYNNNYYYKGDYDPSTAQWGSNDLTYQETNTPGQYQAFSNGNSLGITFGSVKDAIKNYQKKFVSEHPVVIPTAGFQQNFDPDDPRASDPDYQKQLAEYERSYGASITPEWNRTDPYSGGALEDWEVLGQMLGGSSIPTINVNSPRYSAQQASMGMPETISGRNALYGSTPLIANNKIMGYKFNPVVTTGNEFGYEAPNYIKRSDTHGATRSLDSLARIYERPDLWGDYAKNLGNNELYVDAENMDKLPGWTNAGESQYSHQSNGTAGKIASVLGTILSFTPLAPLGLAITTLSQLANGNQLGGILGAIGGGLNIAGVGDKLGSALGVGSNAGKGLLQGGLGTLGSVVSGKDPTQGIISGLGSYLGGEFGDYASKGLGGLFNSADVGNVGNLGNTESIQKILSDVGGKAAGGALQNLISGKNIGEGAALGGLSGGLGSMLSSMTDSGMTPEQREKNLRSSQSLAKTVGKLALSKQKQKRKV